MLSENPNIVNQYMQDMNSFVGATVKQDYKRLAAPLIAAPEDFIPVEQIVSYTQAWHEKLYQMGYEDMKRSWKDAGRVVE